MPPLPSPVPVPDPAMHVIASEEDLLRVRIAASEERARDSHGGTILDTAQFIRFAALRHETRTLTPLR